MALISAAEMQGNVQQVGMVSNVQAAYFKIGQVIGVNPTGHQFDVHWPTIAGASAIELEEASIAVSANHNGFGPSLGPFSGQSETKEFDITLPGPPRVIRSLALTGFKVEQGGEFKSVTGESGLGAARIAAAIFEGNQFGAPVVTVPPVWRREAIPALLTGGTFSNSTFRVPDLFTNKLRLMVIEGNVPEEFPQIRFSVSSVIVYTAPYPLDVEMLNAEGSPVWGLPGPFRESATIDLKQAITQELDKAVKANDPLDTHVTLKSSVEGTVFHFGLHTKGKVVRSFDEKVKLSLEGDRQSLNLPDPRLDDTTPHQVTADVTLKHKGMRLHHLSDEIPDRRGNLEGPVVGVDPVLRHWPEHAFLSETILKLGLYGHAPEPSEISARLMAVSQDGGVTALNGEWGSATIAPSGSIPELVWIELPDYGQIEQPVALEVKSTKGRFYWIGNESPIVRIAVAHSPEPEDKIEIGATALGFTGMESQYLQYSLDKNAFKSTPPLVKTDQFVDLVLTNLTLRYHA